MLFAIGFYQDVRPVINRRALRVSTILLGGAGAGLVNNGFFTEDLPGKPVVSLHGVLHIVGFLVIFGSLIIGRHLRKTPTWHDYGWYATITAFVSSMLIILLAPIPRHSLINRLLVIIAFAWYVVMGCRLLVWERGRR